MVVAGRVGTRAGRPTAPAEAAWMRVAIREARKNVRRGDGGPFGAVIVRGGEILAKARNTVLVSDATHHAELQAIRLASRRLGSWDLTGCRIYSTTEPCPMCFGAIHWAGIGTIISGTRIADVARLGFRELTISNRRMKSIGGSAVELIPGFLRGECLQLLRDWQAAQGGHTY
jgi:tRNA(Arg) A34 adenosine deaminase TadA